MIWMFLCLSRGQYIHSFSDQNFCNQCQSQENNKVFYIFVIICTLNSIIVKLKNLLFHTPLSGVEFQNIRAKRETKRPVNVQ